MCILSFKMGYKDANLDTVGQKHPNFSNNCRSDVWSDRDFQHVNEMSRFSRV